MRLWRTSGVSMVLFVACSDGSTNGVPSTTTATSSSGSSAPSSSAPPSEESETTAPGDSEWNGAPEIDLPGAKQAGCGAKAIREWLRVRCTGVGAAAPTAWEHEKGATGASSGPRQVEITMPVRRGTDTSGVIEWGKTSRRLEVRWPETEAKRPATWGKLSDPFPTPPGPCDALSLEGRGPLGEPCLLKTPSPVSIAWAETAWEVDNKTDSPLASIHTANYGYDAGGKQVDFDDDSSTGKWGGSTMWVGEQVIPKKSKAAKSIDPAPNRSPKVATIELGLCGYGLSMDGKTVFFTTVEGCPDARPKSGGGKPAR